MPGYGFLEKQGNGKREKEGKRIALTRGMLLKQGAEAVEHFIEQVQYA